MHPPISEPDLVTLLEEADAAASRLWRRVRLPRADLDDLRQDLLLDLIRRLPAFDVRRGTMGAFAGIVLRNQASRIATRIRGERKASGGQPLSLDAPGGDGTTLADRLAANDGPAAWHGGRACRANDSHERRAAVKLTTHYTSGTALSHNISGTALSTHISSVSGKALSTLIHISRTHYISLDV